MTVKRTPKKLSLGEHYIIYFDYRKKMVCKFIQVTDKGFNFLNLKTNKCILKHHLYKSKCDNHLKDDWFWINDKLKIE